MKITVLFLGLTYHSCPLMGLNSGSNDAGALWNVRQLRNDKKCETCHTGNFNLWMTCIRKSALVNLHMGFVSRPRQPLLLALQIAKYLPIPMDYTGYYFRFSGPIKQPAEPTNSRPSIYHPRRYLNPGVRIECDTSSDPTIPRPIHQRPVVAYGTFIIHI